MSRDDREVGKPLSTRPPSRDYAVGYGKPPVETRFKPGQSGNPRGRPKGTRNRRGPPALNEERLKEIILEEAYRTITVNDARGPVSIPMAQAVIRSLAVSAAKGNQRAQRLFTELLSTTERDNKRLHDEWLETAIEYKVGWERELDRRKALGLSLPDPIPHPDHIVIEMATGRVRITGPMTREEKPMWDRWRSRKSDAEEAIAELRAELRADPAHPYREQVLKEIAHETKIRDMLARIIPD